MRRTLALLTATLVACNGSDDTTPVDSDTGDPPVVVVDEGEPVVVVSGPPSLPTGATEQLTVRLYNIDGEEVTWASDTPGVLAVDKAGVVNAVSPGTATVTATAEVDGKTVAGELSVVVQAEIPYFDEWRGSGHAQYGAEAFTHWDEDGEIPTFCARCHSTPGYRDYLGADGSAVDSVDAAAPLGTAVECRACHNAAAEERSYVTFPSGVQVSDLGAEARCMTCHQGRASGASLDEDFDKLKLDDPDTFSDAIDFTNVHYYPAGATLFAGQVGGGYQYEGAVYDWRFRHVESANTCTGCHDPHTLELDLESCATCHDTDRTTIETVADLKDVRTLASSSVDYDGDADTAEGIFYEIDGLRQQLLEAMQQYVQDEKQPAICYAAASYPYFFVDTSGNGACDGAEAEFPNAYPAWSPRLARAAYNYQLATQDPGNFAHNAKYTIQLLHDSLQDVNAALAKPQDQVEFPSGITLSAEGQARPPVNGGFGAED